VEPTAKSKKILYRIVNMFLTSEVQKIIAQCEQGLLSDFEAITSINRYTDALINDYLIEGVTLSHLVDKYELNDQEVSELVSELVEGVDYIVHMGAIHLDQGTALAIEMIANQ
jgi:uncharacterized membrane-anchored protein YitT (DUF2179 family)